MKFSEMRDLPDNELKSMLQTLRNNLFKGRLKSRIMDKNDLVNLRSQRRDISRILTIINLRVKSCLSGGSRCQD